MDGQRAERPVHVDAGAVGAKGREADAHKDVYNCEAGHGQVVPDLFAGVARRLSATVHGRGQDHAGARRCGVCDALEETLVVWGEGAGQQADDDDDGGWR